MGNAKLNSWMQWILLVLIIGSLALSYGAYTKDVSTPDVVVPTAAEIAELLVIPTVTAEFVEGELTDTSKVDEIYNKLFEDDAWEVLAEKLAIEEWSDRDNKDLFRAMRDDLLLLIEEEEDIDKVVIRDTSFGNLDAEDGDAVITHELKVYYEDTDGDDLKEYITVVTTIEDNDVEDQDFDFTP